MILGQSPPSSSYNTEKIGLPFFQGKAEFTDLHPIISKWCNAPKKIAEPNDVLISVRAPVGATNVADHICCIGRGLAALRTKNHKYLFYFLRSIEHEIDELGTGTTFRAIAGDTLKNISLPIPPEIEQQQIVEKIEELFSELDAGRRQLETVSQQLKTYRQSVLKYAFEGKLTKKNVKNGELPEGWKVSKISDIGTVKGGKRLPKGEIYSEGKTPFPYIRVTDFEHQGINVQKIKYLMPSTREKIKNYTISKNDVYISIAGSIGITGTIPDLLDGSNLTENAAKITNLIKVENKYLSWFLSSIFGQKQIQHRTIATSQPKLSLFRMETIEIQYPPLHIQNQIINKIESRLSICDKLEETIEECLQQSEALKQSILKQAFEGKLVKPQNT